MVILRCCHSFDSFIAFLKLSRVWNAYHL